MEKLFNHIAIVGLGLIGGSLARVVKEKRLAEKITGFGRNLNRLEKAHQYGLVDRYYAGFEHGLADADLVVIATPVGVIVQQVQELIAQVNPGTLVTDVGSVKGPIIEGIEPIVPEGVYFIGGHPIAGTENSGFESSCAELFSNRICVLTPTQSSNQAALERVRKLWTAAGSRVICMDVETHDKIFAAISHLPHLVAFSLVNAIVDMKNFEQNILDYSAGGFKDFTRIAASDPVMWRDIALMNRDNLLQTLDFFEHSLAEVKAAIQSGNGKKMEELFQRSRDTRKGI